MFMCFFPSHSMPASLHCRWAARKDLRTRVSGKLFTQFTLGLKPIIKLTSGSATSLDVEFIGSECDLLMSGRLGNGPSVFGIRTLADCRSPLLRSFVFRCHISVFIYAVCRAGFPFSVAVAASRITSTTSAGSEYMGVWSTRCDRMVAPIRSAMNRCVFGLIMRSSSAIKYHDGFDFQNGAGTDS